MNALRLLPTIHANIYVRTGTANTIDDKLNSVQISPQKFALMDREGVSSARLARVLDTQ